MVSEIRIRDLVDSPSSYDDGDVVYRRLIEEIDAGNEVSVSFEGIESVPSAFINAAFVRLLETHSFEEVRRLLKIRNSTRHINDLVRSRFLFVSGRTGRTRVEPSARPTMPTRDSTYRAKDGAVYVVRDVVSAPGTAADEYEVVVASEQDVRLGRPGQRMTEIEFEDLLLERGLQPLR